MAVGGLKSRWPRESASSNLGFLTSCQSYPGTHIVFADAKATAQIVLERLLLSVVMTTAFQMLGLAIDHDDDRLPAILVNTS